MKALKIIGWIAGLLIITVVAVAIAVPLLMDANDIKQQLVSQVKERTGRDLKIDGDISLTVFPWAGVELGKTRLSNAAGFADKPFVEVANAGVRVKLLPLLRKEIEMDTVTLKGMTLNLERDKSGRTNWDDLLALAGSKEKKQVPEQQAEVPEIAALAIGGLDIQDAVVSWNDRQADKQINITDMNLKTGELQIGEHVDVTGGFNLDMKNPDFKGRIDLKSAVSANIANNSYRLDGTSLTVDLKDAQGQPVKLAMDGDIEADLIRQFVAITGMKLNGSASYAGKPATVEITSAVDADLKNMTVAMKDMQLNGDAYFNEKPIQLKLNAGIDGNLNKQILNLKDFKADLNGIKTSGKLAIQQLFTIPAFDGQIVVNEFNPRTDLAALGIALPETSDNKAMTKAAAAVNVAGNLTRFRITKMTAQLDDSRITGSAIIHKLTTNPRYEFDLHLDKLDADRYLPPQQTAAATGFDIIRTAHAEEAAVIPVAMLQGLNVDGKLDVDSFVIKNIRAQNTSISLKGADGKLDVNPIKTNLYKGSFTGGIDLNADKQHAQSPTVVFNGNLTGIDVGALSNDLTGGAAVTGSGNISIGISAAGRTVPAL
jgi:AsmA protein